MSEQKSLSLEEALWLVTAKCPAVVTMTPAIIRDLPKATKAVLRRANIAIENALQDRSSSLSEEERFALAAVLVELSTRIASRQALTSRSDTVGFRATRDEKQTLEQAAREAGLDVSNYLRRCVGLPLVGAD